MEKLCIAVCTCKQLDTIGMSLQVLIRTLTVWHVQKYSQKMQDGREREFSQVQEDLATLDKEVDVDSIESEGEKEGKY